MAFSVRTLYLQPKLGPAGIAQWGDVSVTEQQEVVQTRGPGFESLANTEKPGAAEHICNSSSGEQRQAGSGV